MQAGRAHAGYKIPYSQIPVVNSHAPRHYTDRTSTNIHANLSHRRMDILDLKFRLEFPGFSNILAAYEIYRTHNYRNFLFRDIGDLNCNTKRPQPRCSLPSSSPGKATTRCRGPLGVLYDPTNCRYVCGFCDKFSRCVWPNHPRSNSTLIFQSLKRRRESPLTRFRMRLVFLITERLLDVPVICRCEKIPHVRLCRHCFLSYESAAAKYCFRAKETPFFCYS